MTELGQIILTVGGKFKDQKISDVSLRDLDWLIDQQWFKRHPQYQDVMGFLKTDPEWLEGDF